MLDQMADLGATMVAVVFVDLVGSSQASGRRADLQRKLIGLRDYINSSLGTSSAIPFQVVWGDELKGVLLDPSVSWELYRQIFAFMEGTPFYCAIGFGTIDTFFEQGSTTDINLLDGSAFKAARNALDLLKEREIGPYKLYFEAVDRSDYCRALNAFVGIMNDLLRHMTPAQRRVFSQEIPWHASADTAEATPVSRQSAWETLQRARIDAYREADAGITALLRLGAEQPDIILSHEEPRG